MFCSPVTPPLCGHDRSQGGEHYGGPGLHCFSSRGFTALAGSFPHAGRLRVVNDEERQQFAVLATEGEMDGIDLAALDPSDENERRLLIEAEHPELRGALKEGRREIRIGRDTINPVLHIAMHEIVANQLWADDPPEVWATAQRLLGDGYERHEVLHMLASVVAGEVFEIMRHEQAHEIERVRQALVALPGAWQQRRANLPVERHQNRAERRAAARQHRR